MPTFHQSQGAITQYVMIINRFYMEFYNPTQTQNGAKKERKK